MWYDEGMSETNQKSRAYGLGVIGGVSALTGIALQVKPDEAVSNLSLWLQFFGIDRVPSSLATTQADTWGTAIGLSVTALSFLIWAYRRHKSGKAEVGNRESGRLSQRPSYLAEQQAYREERARQKAIDDAEKVRRKRKNDNILALIDIFSAPKNKADKNALTKTSESASKPWWQGRVFFTLQEMGCLIAGITPGQFSNSERAQSVANEILLLARAGKTPLSAYDNHPHIESYPKGEGAPVIIEIRALPGTNTEYHNGECDLNSTVTKRQIARLAQTNGWKLPW